MWNVYFGILFYLQNFVVHLYITHEVTVVIMHFLSKQIDKQRKCPLKNINFIWRKIQSRFLKESLTALSMMFQGLISNLLIFPLCLLEANECQIFEWAKKSCLVWKKVAIKRVLRGCKRRKINILIIKSEVFCSKLTMWRQISYLLQNVTF